MNPESTYILLPDGTQWAGTAKAQTPVPLKKTAGWQRNAHVRPHSIRARFDAAQTTHDNRRHWAAAEALSADAEASPEVRKILRNRARYEVSNNSYAKGILLTLANDTIGTGPRLQMLTEHDDLNRRIERDFMLWSAAIRLPEKLRTMRMARCQDGETFGIMGTNPKVLHDVKLDVMLIEADQITSGTYISMEENEVDGITFDAWGNPDSYRVLKYHPGDNKFNYNSNVLTIPAESMIHCFRLDRPGLHRGVSEITPALPLFAKLRRFSNATLSSAEVAAIFSGIIHTDSPADGEAESLEPMATVELDRNMLLTLPGGWKMSQLAPVHPAATYAEYINKLIEEIIRCLLMPVNLAKGDSGDSSYSSARLDNLVYFRSIKIDQSFIGTVILDRILTQWLREYFLLFPLPGMTIRYSLPRHTWFWEGVNTIDPLKESKGQEVRLKNNLTTLAAEFALMGRDWETEIRQRAREKNLMKELGLTDEEVKPSNNNNNNDKEEEDDMSEDE